MRSIDKAFSALAEVASDNFLELVDASRLNPAVDFIGADLSGMNFGNLDLRNFEFYCADFRGAVLSGAKVRTDRCVGALFGDARPDFFDKAGRPVQQHDLFEYSTLSDTEDGREVYGAVAKYFATKLAFDRMGIAVRFVQDAPNPSYIQRFADIALRRERSSWCAKLLTEIVLNTRADAGTRLPDESVALNAAAKSVHSLRRHELIFALEDHARRTPTLKYFLVALRKRSRSEQMLHAIDRILNERSFSADDD